MTQMTFHRLRTRSTVAALLMALALPALAQHAPLPSTTIAPAASNAPTHQAHAHPHQKHSAYQRMTPEQRMEKHAQIRHQRQEKFKQKLQLTAQQASAWDQYVAAIQPATQPHTARLDRSTLQSMTTPERIDRMRVLRSQRLAQQDRRDEATKTFYAALNAEQQKTFDTQFQRKSPHGKRGRHLGYAHHMPASGKAPTAEPTTQP